MYRIGKEEVKAVERVINSGELFKCNDACQETKLCEEKLKEMFSCDNAIVMTSGKGALISALVGLGIGPGDEVIVPAYTYIATAMSVVAVGAIPVICEVDETLTFSAEEAEKLITKHTKALIPVHIQGFSCNMDAICALADKYSLKIVEDACQADGGSYHGKRLATIGDAGALSFNFWKIICCGEGGALFTKDRSVYERALIYHDASAVAYLYSDGELDSMTEEAFCGTEYRTNEINAAILRQQLIRLDGILEDLRRNKKYIMNELENVYSFVQSNDIEGDCGTMLAFKFNTESEARSFANAQGVNGVIPIDTGKHVYKHWTPIMKRKGAFHPKFDPFKFEENQGLNMNYSEDMCPKTLDILSKVVYVSVNPDWTKEEMDSIVSVLKSAK